jgi:hypothetical protein
MKCMQTRDGSVHRVKDDRAVEMAKEGAIYVKKGVWKKVGRGVVIRTPA